MILLNLASLWIAIDTIVLFSYQTLILSFLEGKRMRLHTNWQKHPFSILASVFFMMYQHV